MSRIVAIVLVCISIGYVGEAKRRPPVSMPLCSCTDNTCLKMAIRSGFRELADPPHRARLPSLDPLHIERLHIRASPNAEASFTQTYHPLDMYGMSSAEVREPTVIVLSTRVFIHFELYMRRFDMLGHYRFNGTVLGMHIDGSGPCNISSVDVTHRHKVTLRRDADDRVSLHRYDVDLEPRKILFDLPDLVRGDADASQRALDLFHKYALEIFDDVKPDYERTFGRAFATYACAFFRGLRMSDLFLSCENTS